MADPVAIANLISGLASGVASAVNIPSTPVGATSAVPDMAKQIKDVIALVYAASSRKPDEITSAFRGNRAVIVNSDWTDELAWDASTPDGVIKALKDVVALVYAATVRDPGEVTRDFRGNRPIVNSQPWTEFLGY